MDSRELKNCIAQHFGMDNLAMYLDAAWSSLRPGYRLRLRKAIQARFAQLDLMDLERLPRVQGHSISISHCRAVGGYCTTDDRYRIGFDVELKSRVQERHLRQVSTEMELTDAPDLCALWTAKEAAFKSLQGTTQPRGVKDIKISSWKKMRDGIFAFRAKAEGGMLLHGLVASDEIEGEDGQAQAITYSVCTDVQPTQA